MYNKESIKKFGFGLMRLPMLENKIDIEQVKDMVDLFMDNGFTYFDTALKYHEGMSEVAIKEALVDRYPRESFLLATKLPAWLGPKTAEEAKAMFEQSLEKTGAGYFDFYLLHNLGGKRTAVFDKFGIWEYLLEKKAQGLIKNLGFSYHGDAKALEEILAKRHQDVDFIQLQINYADWLAPSVQSQKCYEVARKYGKEIVIMEPIRGGALATPPEAVASLMRAADPSQSFASWALRYAASLDGVIAVLSGMSTLEQVEQNVALFKNFKPLNESEQATLTKAQEVLASIPSIPCTNCRYCVQECPAKIEIPMVLGAMNTRLVYDDIKKSKNDYVIALRNGNGAETCVGCGQCESACPQGISIIQELKKACEMFEVNK